MRYLFGYFLLLTLTSYTDLAFAGTEPQKKARIQLYFNKECAGDTIYMELNSFVPLNGERQPKEVYTSVLDKNGQGSVTFHLKSQFEYIFLARDIMVRSLQYKPLLDNYLIEAGDDIIVKVQYDSVYAPHIGETENYGKLKLPDYTISFAGKGGGKFRAYRAYEKPRLLSNNTEPYVPLVDSNGNFNPKNVQLALYERRMANALCFISKRQNAAAYEIAKADMIGEQLLDFAIIYRRTAQKYFEKSGNPKFRIYTPKEGNELRSLIEIVNKGLSSSALWLSKRYAEGALELEITSHLFSYPDFTTIGFYSFLKAHYPNSLRNKVLYQFLRYSVGKIEKQDSIFQDCLISISNEAYREQVKSLLVRSKGAAAYNFTFPTKEGKQVSLSDLHNKVVFVDLYFLGCHACSMFYQQNLRFVEDYFKGKDEIVFLSISTDANESIWEKSLNSGIYTSIDMPNVINLYTDGKGSQHPMLQYYNINAYPCHFLIGKNGRIAGFDDNRNKDFIISAINAELEK